MYDRKYTYEFITPTSLTEQPSGGVIPTSPADRIPSAYPGELKTFDRGFARRAVVGGVSQFVATPLNSMTGGLANPIYQVGRSLVLGRNAAVAGSAVASLILAGVSLAIRAVQDRVSKLEAEAKSKNEREVQLLIAGRISEASTYNSSFFRGVYKTNRGA